MTTLPQQHPLIRKIERFISLTEEDHRILNDIGNAEERYEADQDIIKEGQPPRSVFVVLEGIACRYRLLDDGNRQILTYLIPGDICDLHVFLLKAMDHSIGTLTPVRLLSIKSHAALDIAFRNPRISAALLWSTLQEEAMLRERIVSLGRRDATGRVAYLLCELVWRYQAIGLANGDKVALPLTQVEIADTLGLTPVHVNRVLQRFRQNKLLTLQRRNLELLNITELSRIAQFNADYLHFGKAPEEIQKYIDHLSSR